MLTQKKRPLKKYSQEKNDAIIEQESMMKFLCSGCGACCKIISCRYLGADMKCTIYDTRPDICNVETMAKIRGVDRIPYFIQNTLVCHSLIDYYGMDESFKIDILEYPRMLLADNTREAKDDRQES